MKRIGCGRNRFENSTAEDLKVTACLSEQEEFIGQEKPISLRTGLLYKTKGYNVLFPAVTNTERRTICQSLSEERRSKHKASGRLDICLHIA
jgi:16S rRNA U516 pseudouridylate synthase RsuA-like enzyme